MKVGPDFKGGVTNYAQVKDDLRRLLNDTSAVAVTSLIDYYGLPSDFPGMTSRPKTNPHERVKHVEVAWEADVSHQKFRAFLTLHEFEALLFSDVEELDPAVHARDARKALLGVRAAFNTPEDINEDRQTCPSRRILLHCPTYQKTVHGPLTAKRIGLETMRAQCPHFAEWLQWMEGR